MNEDSSEEDGEKERLNQVNQAIFKPVQEPKP